jgi:lipopolysaccharide/colanic/teichoic acid biosynthesis glycosyltransferase
LIKKFFDVFVVSVLVVPALCVGFIVAAMVFISLGLPVIYRQTRPGLHGAPFTMYKFRTMSDIRHDGLIGIGDEARMTAVGRFLRQSSLDEVPQLWNVLKGDMSLVGPRPLLMDYLPLYSAHQRRRHDIRPGITGWAQINGRKDLSWQEKFDFDIWYVDNQSLLVDIKILALTFYRVIKRQGVTTLNSKISVRFEGNEE